MHLLGRITCLADSLSRQTHLPNAKQMNLNRLDSPLTRSGGHEFESTVGRKVEDPLGQDLYNIELREKHYLTFIIRPSAAYLL